MKSIINKLTTSAVIISMVTACGNRDQKPKDLSQKDKSGKQQQLVPPPPAEPIKINSTSDAEQLTAAGEQLISPYTFMLANKVFEIALTAEPKNQKALFYQHLLKPFMTYKGIMTRVKPFARKYGNIASLEKAIEGLPHSPLRDFLVDGKEDIKNYEDIQTWIVSLRNGFNDFRLFLRNNPDLDLVINLNPDVMRVGDSGFGKRCRVVAHPQSSTPTTGVNVNVGSSTYQVIDGKTVASSNGSLYEVKCDYRNILQVKFNPADAMAMRQILGGYVIMFGMYTWYSVAGLETYLENHKDGNFPQGAAAQVELENIPSLGKLRADNDMKQVLDIGADLVPAVRWAIEHQKELCPNGPHAYQPSEQREGHVFSGDIFCIDNMPETERTLALFEQALKGVINTEIAIPGTNDKAVANVDYLAWMRKPVTDLRSVMPASFDGCNNPKTLRDKTYGGVFPNGDAEMFLLGRNTCHVN